MDNTKFSVVVIGAGENDVGVGKTVILERITQVAQMNGPKVVTVGLDNPVNHQSEQEKQVKKLERMARKLERKRRKN